MSSDDFTHKSTTPEEPESTRPLKRQRNDIDKEKSIKSVAGIKMEKSIFGLEPSDEFIKEVSDWIWKHARNCEHKVEVEAKIGIFVDQTGQRAELPVAVETILTNTDGLRFISDMTISQHKHYNKILNDRTSQSSQTPTRIQYAHSKELDSFYPIGKGQRKIRVTKDLRTDQVKDVIEKVRVADLAIYSPKRLFDWRISINMEIPQTVPQNQNMTYSRKKDRLSYTQQEMQVDLTQVFSPNSETPSHELELEMHRPKFLIEEGFKRERGLPNMCKIYLFTYDVN
ncbi:mRNA triphosphatase CET1 [Wallemia mellicola]|nr:mRNA triphosphatase CET1 [Wallemia mellicola]TIC29005.1 mRNA triphosphatase CET1 [Wallemia mellicola]TIC74174.1 mRNA triphosphatase CET1 [Wallemia mellicola]